MIIFEAATLRRATREHLALAEHAKITNSGEYPAGQSVYSLVHCER